QRLGYVVGFFLQGEGGIRYRNVTGVQTCALPIWHRADGGGRGHHHQHDAAHPEGACQFPFHRWSSPASAATVAADRRCPTRRWRSGERRVGKESPRRAALCWWRINER